MRKREEIENDVNEAIAEVPGLGNTIRLAAMLDVLLDIRELLMRGKIVEMEGDYKD